MEESKGTDLAKDLLKMLENRSENDVSIVCKDGKIKAHRDILVARSDFFANLLNNNNSLTNQIFFHDVDQLHMEKVVRYLFTGVIDFDNFQKVEDRLRLMSLLREMKLEAAYNDVQENTLELLRTLTRTSSSPTAFRVMSTLLEVSRDLSLERIHIKCLKFISKNLHTLLFNDNLESREVSRELFKSLSLDSVMELMRSQDISLQTRIESFNMWFSDNEK